MKKIDRSKMPSGKFGLYDAYNKHRDNSSKAPKPFNERAVKTKSDKE